MDFQALAVVLDGPRHAAEYQVAKAFDMLRISVEIGKAAIVL